MIQSALTLRWELEKYVYHFDPKSEVKEIRQMRYFSVFLFACMLLASPAASQYRSYFELMDKWANPHKIGFAERMIVIYERSNRTYQNIINNYKSRFGHHSWFKGLEQRYAWQVNEIDRYKNFLLSATKDKSVTKTTITHSDGKRKFNTGKPIIEEVTATKTEENGNLVRVYSVTRRTITQNYTVHHWRTTKTTKWWSDGTQSSTTATKITKIEQGKDVKNSSNRELVDEYYIYEEAGDKATDEFLGTKTPDTLSLEEYLQRADVSLSGTDNYVTAVRNLNPRINTDYITRQNGMYKLGANLQAIGAPTSWSRGWTGLGSRIAIMDTGIDVDHPEFEDKIIAMQCFTSICEESAGEYRQTIDDKSRMSHGTHVASIAAASLDGAGMTGVAPDAELLIGKIAYDGGFYDFASGGEALSWAVKNGAVVANFSGGVRVTPAYVSDLEQVDKGLFVYRGNIDSYKKYGYNAMLERKDWPSGMTPIMDAMKGNEIIVVLSAGNDRKPISNVATHIALDEEIGDRVLVAGSLDLRSNKTASHSNLAGTVCIDWDYDTERCLNERRISDRYLLAPGQWVMGANDGGDYIVLSGTSMAAPHVSGAVAVIHQMWPHMRGENIAQLLLDTANKSIVPDYDEAKHGQGVLDLASATAPQGHLGIPVSGRIDGNIQELSSIKPIATAKKLETLSRVMAIDAYDRDFYFDANLEGSIDTRSVSPIKSALLGELPDFYMAYSGGSPIQFENSEISIGNDGSFGFKHALGSGFSVGLLSENKTFLGNFADSLLMKVDGSYTLNAEYRFEHENLFGSISFAATELNVDDDSYLKSADAVLSHSSTFGLQFENANSKFGVVASMPVVVGSGDLTFELPTSVSADGRIVSQSFTESLATKAEIDYGIFLTQKLDKFSNFNAYAELRNSTGGIDDTVEFGFNFSARF